MRIESRGLGLVELLCVIAIASITASFAALQIRGVMISQAMRARVEEFAASARFAKSQAISAGIRVSMCRTEGEAKCKTGNRDWASGWMLFTDSAASGTPRGVFDGTDTILWVEPAWKHGQIVQTGKDNYVLSYQPTGIATAAAESFTISPRQPVDPATGKANTHMVCINKLGQIRHLVAVKCD